MAIKIENGKLIADVTDLLDGLTADEKMEIADTLAITDHVIQYVAQQIVTGWTGAGSHGCNDSNDAEPISPLGKAIRAIAIGAGSVAAEQVKDLSAAMLRQHAYHDQMQRWAWQMWHAMNDARRDRIACPTPPEPPNALDTTPDAFIVVAND
jgi:hypothetical protein